MHKKNNDTPKNNTDENLKATEEKLDFKNLQVKTQQNRSGDNLMDLTGGLSEDPGFLGSNDVFDEADHAQWQQLREQAAVHARALALNKPENHPDFDGVHCVECDIDIPSARLKLHKVRCVDCQNDLEEERKREGRLTPSPVRKNDSGWSD